MASVADDAAGAQRVSALEAQVVEVVDHQYAVEHCHAKQGDETHSGRDAEGQATQPQGSNAANERQRYGGEYHQRPCDTAESEEKQQQDE